MISLETREYPELTTALDSLQHYSRQLGADESLVLGGGGNTSIKARGFDVAGRPLDVLLIKGSGSELKAAHARDFTPMRLADLLVLRTRDQLSDEDMVEYLARCKLDPNAPRPSIETLLHAFIPSAAVFHSHADAILMLTNSREGDRVLRELFGDSVVSVPYQRPGFALSKAVADAMAAAPAARGVILLNHGLVTWGDSAATAYEAHIALVRQASQRVKLRPFTRVFVHDAARARPLVERQADAARIAPLLRGALSRTKRVVLAFDDEEDTLEFVNSSAARRASAAGAATPDHILTTKNLPLWLDLPPDPTTDAMRSAVTKGLVAYRQSYLEYVQRWRTSEPLLPGEPRVIAVPGIGLFAAGPDARTAALARAIYRHTIQIIRGAEVSGGYRSLSEAEAFRAEYWPLELYKLSLAPPARELAGRVALVTGAGSGLGRAIALTLARAGAHVVVTDLDPDHAKETAALVTSQEGASTATAAQLDVTKEADITRAFQRAGLEFGGLDLVISNAGFAHCAPLEEMELADWERSFAVNSTGHFLVARAALQLFRAQGTGGSIVFVATKNVTAPGADFAAYSASKAAEMQLARVAAIEGGPIGVRVNAVNPDAIFAGSHLWDDIRQQRAEAHGVSPEELELHYRKRSILGLEVRAEDVAEAVLFLASDRSSRTTGAMIPVDGGVREAFPR